MRKPPLLLCAVLCPLMIVTLSGCPQKTSPPASSTPPKPPSPAGSAATPAPQPAAQPAATAKGTGTQWPRFRGVDGDGIAADTGINKDWGSREPRTLWQETLGDRGFAGPSVAAGKVFIIDHSSDRDIVRALSLDGGKEVWRFEYQDTASENYGFARSTPTYDDGKLYTLSRLGKLHCLDAESGQQVWVRDLVAEFGGQRPQWDYAASPLVDGKALIVCPGGETGVAALDKTSGATLWTGGIGGPPGYATPVPATLAGKRQYVIFAGTVLYAVATDSGQTLWQTPWKTEYDVNAATPIIMEDFVFVTSGYNVGCGLFRIQARGASAAWKTPEIQSHFNTPVYVDGFLYGIGDPGNLVCVNPQDGSATWKQQGFEKGGVCCVDGVILAVDGKGGDVVMAAAEPQAYRELGRINPLGGQSWTAPIVADGKLILRNTKAVAAIDLL